MAASLRSGNVIEVRPGGIIQIRFLGFHASGVEVITRDRSSLFGLCPPRRDLYLRVEMRNDSGAYRRWTVILE
jgi:hypothetical protein